MMAISGCPSTDDPAKVPDNPAKVQVNPERMILQLARTKPSSPNSQRRYFWLARHKTCLAPLI
jgi:hypothetical protein